MGGQPLSMDLGAIGDRIRPEDHTFGQPLGQVQVKGRAG